MTNNFQQSIPVLIDPRLISIFKAKTNNVTNKFDFLDHSPRPYRILVTDDNKILSEWMIHRDKSVERVPWGFLKEKYLSTEKTKEFFLLGYKGQYHILKDGTFKIPTFNEPIKVYINGQSQTFENIYPNIHFIIQAKSSGNNTTVNQAVGISWRKNIPITNDWKIDFTITLFISPDEQNLIWKSIVSNPQNEKYKYKSTLNFIPNENKIDVRVEK